MPATGDRPEATEEEPTMTATETTTTVKATKRLSLTKETLRTLTKDELRLVAGGGRRQSQCTYEESGCIN